MEGERSLDEAAEALPEVTAVLDPMQGPLTVKPPPLENYFIVGLAGQDTIFHGAISLDEDRVVDMQPLFASATQDLPGAFAFSFQLPIFRLGGGSGAAVGIDITGQNIEEVQSAAFAMFPDLMGSFESVQPKPANFNVNGPELSIEVDDLRATRRRPD